jgi:hypothetical protein
MPTKPTPQELGRQFERDFAENELGGLAKPVPGSGALPQYNLDVDQLSILWSLKHTTHATAHRRTRRDDRGAAHARPPRHRSTRDRFLGGA